MDPDAQWALSADALKSPESIKFLTRTVEFSKIDGILTCQLSIKDKL